MIVIFAKNGSNETLLYFLERVRFIKFIVLYKYNKYYFSKAKIIIPIDIASTYELYKYERYRHKFLISSPKTIKMLDDKILFYNFIRDNKILQNSDIKLIDTYDKSYNGPNKYGKYMIKGRNNEACMGNNIKIGHIHDFIEKYSKNSQVQDYIEIKTVKSISFVCNDGEISSSLQFMNRGKLVSKDMYSNLNLLYVSTEKNLLDVCQKIAKAGNLYGINEVEFIEDYNGNTYIMECNPRISGVLKGVVRNGSSPYIDNVIVPYCDSVIGKIFKQKHYPKIKTIVYYGGLIIQKYNRCDCGIIDIYENHFD